MTNTETTPSPAPKKVGPFRTGLIVPVLIVFTIFGLYMHFFLDHHIRRGVEIFGSYVHGAEVNLSHFESSFFKGYVGAGRLQVTDKDNPDRNLIEIGKMRFDLLWDALLRAKFVIEDASIEQIQFQSPRSYRGWVRPPTPAGKGSAIQQLEGAVLTQLEEQNEENLLGSLSQLAQGISGKDIMKNIEDQLQAEKRIKELEAAMKEKEKLWKERLENLPKKEELKTLEAKAKALKFDSKKPVEFAKDLEQLRKLVKEADAKVDEIKSAGKDLDTDLNKFNKEVGSIDEWIEKDIEDIEKRLKIPKLDAGAFSKSLFMRLFADKLVTVYKYATLAKQYVPLPNKKKDVQAVIPPPRGEGKTYTYPRANGYPLFWLKKSVISSKSTPDGFAGDLEGVITNVASHQALVGQPTMATIKGGFPQMNISGILGQLTLDHRQEPGKNSAELLVGSYILEKLKLSQSKEVNLELTKADASSEFRASMIGEEISVQLNNVFRSPKYEVKAESSSTQRILDTVMNTIPAITVDATAKGRWDKLRFDIDSNLGRAISDSFQAFMKSEITRIKQEIRAQVDARVAQERGKLEAEYKKLKGEVDNVLKSKEKEIEEAKGEIKKLSQSSEKEKSKAKDDLKKKGKELLKKLKL